MERDLSVNAPSNIGDEGAKFGNETLTPRGAGDLGPCLYLGPAGQRCNRRATLDCFCARHQLGKLAEDSKNVVPRRALALFGILAALWPLLVDIVRALIRLLR
jgi:hypothetical protein